MNRAKEKRHSDTEAWELTLLALIKSYLAAGLPAQHALMSAKADYACGFRIESR
jgi:hypothetical protein